jgi:hypothetical protein
MIEEYRRHRALLNGKDSGLQLPIRSESRRNVVVRVFRDMLCISLIDHIRRISSHWLTTGRGAFGGENLHDGSSV